jgi:hypothetical protein
VIITSTPDGAISNPKSNFGILVKAWNWVLWYTYLYIYIGPFGIFRSLGIFNGLLVYIVVSLVNFSILV